MRTHKKFRLNQLAFRTFFVFWLAFLALVTLMIALPYFDLRLIAPLKQNEIANYEKQLVEAMRTNKLQSIISGMPILPSDRYADSRPILVNTNTKEVLGKFPEEERDILRFARMSSDPGQPKRKSFNDLQISGPFQIYMGEQSDDYFLFFISYISPQREILNYMFDNPLTLLILIVLITTPLLWWFTRTIIKPIANLQRAANAAAMGNFKIDRQLTLQGPIELRQVGQSFNRMSSAIDNLLSNQQSLLSSISHELKTPLTRLQLAIALIRHKHGESDSIKQVEREIERMDKMINELLMLSRQKMNSQTERMIFNAKEIWEQVIKDAQFEAEQRHINFEINVNLPEQPIFINGNLRLLTSAVENILTNALKYTKNKINLNIFLQEEEEEEEFLRICVWDNGSGVNPSEFEKIFKPFYRVDEARTRTTGGTGLGLTIVANVIDEHQGKVWAEKSPMGGLCVTIQLPLWIS